MQPRFFTNEGAVFLRDNLSRLTDWAFHWSFLALLSILAINAVNHFWWIYIA